MPVCLNFQLGEKSLTLDASLVDMDKHWHGNNCDLFIDEIWGIE